MTKEIFLRNRMFYGTAGLERLQKASAAVVGLGGVGSYAAEALVRAGIGRMRIIDCDSIKATDVNRQLLALSTNLDTPKVEAARMRLLAINPDLQLDARQEFFHFDTAEALITQDLDFVIDAIDSLNPKAALIQHCTERNIRILSALGASSRSDPFAIRITTLSQTVGCPLARALRRHLHRKGISANPPVLYSQEPPVIAQQVDDAPQSPESVGTYSRGRKRRALPSISTLPGIVGLMAANYVLFELLKDSPSMAACPAPAVD
jgi:tRNA A37 threonylcarbamoyladenosine dehydratase